MKDNKQWVDLITIHKFFYNKYFVVTTKDLPLLKVVVTDYNIKYNNKKVRKFQI